MGVSGTSYDLIGEYPRLRAAGTMSIWQFLRELGRTIPPAYAFDYSGEQLRVLPAYPSEFITAADMDINNLRGRFVKTITYQVVRREPGTTRDHPFDAPKYIKPTIREQVRLEEETQDGEDYIEIKGQWMDNLVQLDCWCLTNKEADELMEWLEAHLVIFAGYYKELGVQEMYYFRGGRFTWGTTEEEAMVRWRNPLKVRSMTEYVRTEDLWGRNLYSIKQIIEEIVIYDRLSDLGT